MFSPNNPSWSWHDWVMLAILLLCSASMLAWDGYGAYAGILPIWVTLPLTLAYLTWCWRPVVRWWRRHG